MLDYNNRFLESFHDEPLDNKTILITGGSGFIGSNLAAYFIKWGVKKLIVLDNLATGKIENIEPFLHLPNFSFVNGDIRNLETCKEVSNGVDVISHQAALGSVPRSINDPITSNEVNITGFLNMLVAANENNVKRLVYAASSSTYGDSTSLPKTEAIIGNPLSPYAVTKYVNELYASVFARTYGLETIGLRYFNVFGPNQDPFGVYAAVIPKFIQSLLDGESPKIDGDGEQTRDFTYIDNIVQLNIKALFSNNQEAVNQVYNGACNDRISVNTMWQYLNEMAGTNISANYVSPRKGDVRDSLASIDKANQLLGYAPSVKFKEGLALTFEYFKSLQKK